MSEESSKILSSNEPEESSKILSSNQPEESSKILSCSELKESLEMPSYDEPEESEETPTCDVCYEAEYPKYHGSSDPYGWCQYCEEFSICYKQDNVHQTALLYNEDCREHHNGGYSICIPCGLKAFTTKNKDFEPGEEHCICPICSYDFGLLRHLLYKK